MKKKNLPVFITANTLTLPIRALSLVVAIIGVVVIRGVRYANKLDSILGKYERARKKSFTKRYTRNSEPPKNIDPRKIELPNF